MRVLFFGHLKSITQCAETHLPCEDTNADGVWRALVAAYPGLAPCRPSVRLARNSEFASPDTQFLTGDEVALIPPVSGG